MAETLQAHEGWLGVDRIIRGMVSCMNEKNAGELDELAGLRFLSWEEFQRHKEAGGDPLGQGPRTEGGMARQGAPSRVKQAETALAELFKHAEALKAAQANSARIDTLMADAAKPEEQPQPEPPTEIDPWLERCRD